MLAEEEIDPQAVQDTLEGLQGEIEEKADGLACVIKDLQAQADAIKKEASVLSERARLKRSQAENLSGYLMKQMQAVGKTKIETTRHMLSIRKTPAAVKIEDEVGFVKWAKAIHGEFLRFKEPEIDKTAVKDALKSGLPVPGAVLENGLKLSIK